MNGVWAVVTQDYYQNIDRVYEAEIDALRSINFAGYGKVVFVPWGKTLSDLEQER